MINTYCEPGEPKENTVWWQKTKYFAYTSTSLVGRCVHSHFHLPYNKMISSQGKKRRMSGNAISRQTVLSTPASGAMVTSPMEMDVCPFWWRVGLGTEISRSKAQNQDGEGDGHSFPAGPAFHGVGKVSGKHGLLWSELFLVLTVGLVISKQKEELVGQW